MNNVYSLLIIIGWIGLVFIAAIVTKKTLPDQKELTRKIIHIGVGPVIILAWLLQIPYTIAVPAASIVTCILLINYQFRIFPSIEDISRNSYGTVAYGLSITLLLILFWPANAAAATAGVLTMSFADGLAALVGRNLASPSWQILGQRKSLLGTLTMTITVLIVLISIITINDFNIYPLRIIFVTMLAVGLEQVSKWGLDNVSVPIAVACSWSWMTTI